MRSTAAPSDTPGRRPKEIETAGSCPTWFTDWGPTVSLARTTDSSGMRLPFEPRVQRVLDLRGVQADGRRLVAVDQEVDARALHLHVVRDVHHLRHRRNRILEARRPLVQILGVQ